MQGIDPKALAKGALVLTLGYFLLWLIGPLAFDNNQQAFGLPLWFWCSCVAAPILLCLVTAVWLRVRND